MIDLTGQKFNRLTVIKKAGQTKRRIVIWECLCDCGKVKNVQGTKIRRGLTKSCGCLKTENITGKIGAKHHAWEGYEEISLSLFSRIKNCAILRDIEFNVSIEYLWNLFVKQNKKCAITGKLLQMPVNLRKITQNSDEFLASLDRINNDIGYLEGNLRWVCKRVNYMKHNMEDSEFLKWVKEIYENNNLSEREFDPTYRTTFPLRESFST